MLELMILIGVALSLLKGTELLLSSSQREAVQNEFEAIAIEIDDADPRQLGERLGTSCAQLVFIVITYFEFLLIIPIAGLGLRVLGLDREFEEAYGPSYRTLQFVGILVSLATLALAWRWPLPQLIRWTVGSARWWPMFGRFAVIVLAGGWSWFAYQTSSPDWFNRLGLCDQSFPMECGLVAFTFVMPLFTIFWVLTQCVGLMLQVKVPWVGLFVKALLRISRFFIWRIVEYEKGATAALVLLLTIALSVVKVMGYR